ncbi:hypothetical protein ACS0TY_013037 [Phlomoides rotata]
MGRKRKTDVQEDKTNNGCCETIFSKEKTYNSNAMGAMNVGNGNNAKKTPDVTPLKKDSKVIMDVALRRSVRIKSSGLPSGNLKSHPIVEHVNLVEKEQGEAPYSQQVDTSPLMKEKGSEIEPLAQQASTPEMNEGSLEEKVDYLVRTADEFKSKFVRHRTNEGPSDLNYKSLYFEAQKKVIETQKKLEALTEEHYALVKKFEFAQGKIEVYESMKDSLTAQKEVILVSALAKAEPTANTSAQLGPTCSSPPPPSPLPPHPDASEDPKRKKNTRKNLGKRWLGAN